jgi:hypothetical protein
MGRPMSDARRRSRLIKQGKLKSINMGDGRELKIPTEREVEEYIIEKTNKMTYTPVEVLQPVDIITNNI